MKGTLPCALALLIGLVLIPAPMLAHHGTSAYDTTKTLKLTGSVASFNWENPHASLGVDVKGENGEVEHWSIELTSPGMLTRSGWHHDSLKAGDEVTVYIHPVKSGAKLGIFQKVVFADGRPELIDPRQP